MAEPSDTIMEEREELMEEREELMVSFIGDYNPKPRPAHFLKPSVTSINGQIFELPSLSPSSLPPTFEPTKWPLKVTFNGWRYPTKDWTSWVDRMRSKYQSLWEKAGIYEAIMNSTYQIRRNDDLVLGIAERWCPKTNTCIFPWAEATITLEDVMILAGFSVLGDPFDRPIATQELKEIEDKLIQARAETLKSKSHKARPCVWKKMFMNGRSDIEHEAFIVMWLSMFVFPHHLISKHLFSIAIYLARGIRIALAPAILASIYKDLSLLKETIVGLKNFDTGKNEDDVLEVTIRSPFQLVQIWAWERIVALQPNPNSIKCGEPMFARWHKVKHVKVKNVRLALDSAGEVFLWRPYPIRMPNWNFPKFYGEKEMWVQIDPDVDQEIEAFARCLRVSKFFGHGCVEYYFPHRVAMQFGMDQDLPGCVALTNKSPEIAWNDYSKPMSDVKLYVPSRFFEAGVTTRYSEWWKQSIFSMQDAIKGVVKRQRSEKLKQVPQGSKGKKVGNDADVPPGFLSKSDKAKAGNSVKEEKETVVERMRSHSMHDSLGKRPIGVGKHLLDQSQSFSASIADNGAAIKTKSLMKQVENFQIEATVGGLNLKGAMEDASESKAGSLVYNSVSISGNEGKVSTRTPEIPGLQLEARISRLEGVVAELKAMTFGDRFE